MNKNTTHKSYKFMVPIFLIVFSVFFSQTVFAETDEDSDTTRKQKTEEEIMEYKAQKQKVIDEYQLQKNMVKEEFQTQKNVRLEEKENSKAQLQELNQVRVEDYKRLQEERQQKFEEIKAQYELKRQEWAQKKEMIQDENIAKKIDLLNKKIALADARFNKATEHLYWVIDKVDTILKEQEDSGFGTTTFRTDLDDITAELQSIQEAEEMLISETNAKLAEPQNLTIEQLRQINSDFNDQMKALIQRLGTVKTSLVELIQQVK